MLHLRADYAEVIREAVTQVLPDELVGMERGTLEILDRPVRTSPFLTLAGRSVLGLRTCVAKVVVVPQDDPSSKHWRTILRRDTDRLRRESQAKLGDRTEVGRLDLPFTWELVQVEHGDISLRPESIFEGFEGEASVRLAYSVRPYIPWPRLQDTGYSEETSSALWEKFRSGVRLAPGLGDAEAFDLFARVALVSGNSGAEDSIVLLSAWRLLAS